MGARSKCHPSGGRKVQGIERIATMARPWGGMYGRRFQGERKSGMMGNGGVDVRARGLDDLWDRRAGAVYGFSNKGKKNT